MKHLKKLFEIDLDTIPKPQARARVTKFGTYDPTKDYKSWLRYQILEQFRKVYEAPLDQPLQVIATFRLPIPKSISKKARQRLLDNPHHCKRPDVKNLYTAIEDAMNEIVYKDDCLIFAAHIYKCYSESPGISIVIRGKNE